MNTLYLKWKDLNNKIYTLAALYKEDDFYYIIINRKEIDKAKENGCYGIGTIDTNKSGYKSKELFAFFKNRIIQKDNSYLDEFLEKYNIKKYDEMEILRITKGILGTDRYFIE